MDKSTTRPKKRTIISILKMTNAQIMSDSDRKLLIQILRNRLILDDNYQTFAVVQKLVDAGIQVCLKEHRWAQENSALHLATKYV